MSEPGARRRIGYVAVTGLMFLAFSYLDVIAGRLVPFDVTLVAAGITGFAVYLRVITERSEPPKGLGIILILWVAFLIGVHGSTSSEYASSKVTSLFTLALLCALGGLYILRSSEARAWWLKLNVAIGAVTAAVAYFLPNQEASETFDRLAIEGGSAISTGRAAGAAFVVLVVVALQGGRYRKVSILAAIALSLIMVDTGSRGPLLASVIAVLVAAMAPTRGRFARVLLGVSAVGASAYLAVATDLVAERVTTLGQSGQNRLYFWELTWNASIESPLGVGWGGLQSYLPALRDYPHNVLLETFAEASWIAGIILVVALWIGLRRQRAAAVGGIVEMAMLGLLVFHLLNAMVSSDVPGNRGLWVSLGAALVVVVSRHEPSSQPEEITRSGSRP